MAAPTSVRLCGIVAGEEYSDPEFKAGGPGAFDQLERYFLVSTTGAGWLANAKAIYDRGDADTGGYIGGSYSQMYVVEFNIAGWYGDYAEVIFSFKGRFDSNDSKMRRKIAGAASSQQADLITITNGRRAIKLPPASYLPATEYSTWSLDVANPTTLGPSAINVGQGEVTLTDTWVNKTDDLTYFIEDVNFIRNDSSTSRLEPGQTGFMPLDPPTPPQNPWADYTGNKSINWPYGWVLQNRSLADSAGSFNNPGKSPGQIHVFREVWRYIQKFTLA